MILDFHQEEFFNPETQDRGLVKIKLLSSATKEIAVSDVVHLLFDEKIRKIPSNQNPASDGSQVKHKLWEKLNSDVAFVVKPLAQALEDAKVDGFSIDLEIVPDAGFALTSHVKRNLKNLAEILENVVKDGENYNLLIVAEWNQICKSCGDIDELPDPEVVQIIRISKIEDSFGSVEL